MTEKPDAATVLAALVKNEPAAAVEAFQGLVQSRAHDITAARLNPAPTVHDLNAKQDA